MIPYVSPTYLRLLKYLRRYLFPYVTLAVLSMLALSATQGAIPFLARNLVNQISTIKNPVALHSLLLAILVLFTVRAVASFGNNYLNDYVGQKVTLDLRALVPPGRLIVTESGISTANDVKRVRDSGIDAFLVGEAFMRAADPGAELEHMFATH